MALLTLHRSPSANTASGPTAKGERIPRRGRLQKRESFALVKGAVLLLDEGEEPDDEITRLSRPCPTGGRSGAQQRHLEAMIALLRPEDKLKLAVQLESVSPVRVRYLLVVSTLSRKCENLLLGMDFLKTDSDDCTIGLVLPIWSDTQVYLDGDGGFSVVSAEETRIFKPVSIQTMWSVLQALHRCCESAVIGSVIPGSGLDWAQHYRMRLGSDRHCIHEWNAMTDLESVRRDYCREGDRAMMERRIKSQLREIMWKEDLENITSKQVRCALEQCLGVDMKDYKEFIDNEMMVTMAQMDKPSRIFDYLYLGSEWNAANFEELQKNGVGYILNVTREIDNFFPETFTYLNIRVYDVETTDLLSHWNNTYHFIHRARIAGSRVLVHCKMGVSRSASTVVAFVMKEYGWSLEDTLGHIRERRPIVQPNAGFLKQLATYSGILQASKQRHSALWRRKSREMRGLPLQGGEGSDSESEEEGEVEKDRESEGEGELEEEKGPENEGDGEVFTDIATQSEPPQDSSDPVSGDTGGPYNYLSPNITVEEPEIQGRESAVLSPTVPSPSRSGRMNLLSLMQSISVLDEEQEEKEETENREIALHQRRSPAARRRSRADSARRRVLVQQRHVDVSPEPRSQLEHSTAGEGQRGEEPHFSTLNTEETEGEAGSKSGAGTERETRGEAEGSSESETRGEAVGRTEGETGGGTAEEEQRDRE